MVETTATNPELLQEQVARILIQPLEAASVVLAAGLATDRRLGIPGEDRAGVAAARH